MQLRELTSSILNALKSPLDMQQVNDGIENRPETQVSNVKTEVPSVCADTPDTCTTLVPALVPYISMSCSRPSWSLSFQETSYLGTSFSSSICSWFLTLETLLNFNFGP